MIPVEDTITRFGSPMPSLAAASSAMRLASSISALAIGAVGIAAVDDDGLGAIAGSGQMLFADADGMGSGLAGGKCSGGTMQGTAETSIARSGDPGSVLMPQAMLPASKPSAAVTPPSIRRKPASRSRVI